MRSAGGWGPVEHRDGTAWSGGRQRPHRRVRLPRRGGHGRWTLVATLAVAVVAVLAVVAMPGRADAHAELLSTEPAASEQLDSAPDAVVLHFSEAVNPTDDTLEVLDVSGDRIDTGEPEHPDGDRTAVSVSLPDLDDGAYVVAWRVVSSDSHPIGGAFTFRVGDAAVDTGDDQALIDEVLGGADGGDTALGAAYGVVRFAAFAGIAVLVGATVFLTWLWPPGRVDRHARRVVAVAWAITVAATILSIPFQGAYVAGGALADVADPGMIADELGTRTGRAWLARLVVLVLAAAVVVRARRALTEREAGTRTRVAVALAGLVLLVTVSLTGHAVSGDLVALAFVTDVVHLVGVSVWLGGLAVLVAAVLRRPTPPAADDVGAIEPVVTRFSRVAFAAVVLIVVSGTVQGWRQVGSYDALLETAYGRLLVTKVALVAAMLVAAALSRSWVRERIAGRRADAGPEHSPSTGARLTVLRRSVAAEAGGALAVVAVTALLVNAVPGGTASATGGGGPFSAQITEDDIVLSVEVVPAEVGPVGLHLYVNEPSGAPVRPEEVEATFTLPERDLGPLTVPLVDFGQGHYSADGAELPFAGEWDLDVVVRTSDIDQTRFEAVVSVS